MQELPSLAQRPTWPLRWHEGINCVPRRMCGAAAVCYCTCSMDATHGYVTIPILCVSRWDSFLCCCGEIRCSQNYTEGFWHCLSCVCQIVNEPPPLWEVPSNCNNFTAKVFRAGLQKDPDRRASARELRRKTTKALRAGWCIIYSKIILYYKNKFLNND